MSGNAGGVRNLRAMFENKQGDQSTSPPSRGRSPSGSVASGNSRQVSKVRASFVAVERPGDLSQAPQWGLRKASDVSSMAEVRQDKNQATVEEQAPTSPHTAKHSIDGGLGSILKGSAFEGTPSKQRATDSKVNGGPANETKTDGVASRAAAMVERMKANENPGPPPPAVLKTTSTAHPVKSLHPKQGPVVHPPSSPKAKAPKTPTSPIATRLNIKGGPAKIKGVMESAKKAGEAREAARKEQTLKSPVTQPSPKTSSASGKSPSTATAPTAASKNQTAASEQPRKPVSKPRTSNVPAKLPSAVTASTAASDAHRTEEAKPAPKPRLSAVPAKLPSAVTATTAASAAKTDREPPVARKSQSRPSLASGGHPGTKMPSAVTTGTASTLAKKSSRASLANGDRPRSRLSTKPDESFLTRMARPTASSALKTHEKPAAVGKASTKAASRPSRGRKSDQSHTTTSEPAEEPAMNTEDQPASIDPGDAMMPQGAIEEPEVQVNGGLSKAPPPEILETST